MPPIAVGISPYSAVADIGSKIVTMTVVQLCAVAPTCRRELATALSVREKKPRESAPKKRDAQPKTIGVVNTVRRTRS